MATLIIPKRVKLLGNTTLAAEYIKLADNLLFMLKQSTRVPYSFNTVNLADGTIIRVGITGSGSEVTINSPWPIEKDKKEEEEKEVTLYYIVCGDGFIVLSKDPETLLTEYLVKIVEGEKGPEIEAISEDESIVFCKWLSDDEDLEDAEFIENIKEVETCEDLENISCDVNEVYKNPLRPAIKVKKDTIFVALFRKQFTLTYEAGEGGFIQGDAEQTVFQGEDGEEVIAQPNLNHNFTGWNDFVATAARTDTNIQADLHAIAQFQYVPPVYYYYITLKYFDESELHISPSIGDTTSFTMRAFNSAFSFSASGTWDGTYWVIAVSENVPHWIARTQGHFNFVDRSPYHSAGPPSYPYPQHEIIRNTLYTQYPGKYKVSAFYTDQADCIMPGYHTLYIHYIDTQWWRPDDGNPYDYTIFSKLRNVRINSSVPYKIRSHHSLDYIDFIFLDTSNNYDSHTSLAYLMAAYHCDSSQPGPNYQLTSVDYPWAFKAIHQIFSGTINSCVLYESGYEQIIIPDWDITLSRSPEDFIWEMGFTTPYGEIYPKRPGGTLPDYGPVKSAEFQSGHDFNIRTYPEDTITISVDYGD